MSVISFEKRACNAIIQGASDYKKMFLEHEYIIYSPDFVKQPYYVINALVTNYLHLTGVNTTLSTYDFFNMSLNGTLSEKDFDFTKPNKSAKSVRGSVRQKIQALASMPLLFSNKLLATEDFTKNSMTCSLATADNKITMGFVNDIDAKPKTLLWGNELNKANAVNVALVLRRNRSSEIFDTIIQGDTRSLLRFISKCILK